MHFYSKLKLPAKASLWYTVANLFSKLLGVLAVPLFTRITSQEEYGAFGVYMSLLGASSILLSSITSGSHILRGIQENCNNIKVFLQSYLCVFLVFFTVICLLLFTLSPVFNVSIGLCTLLCCQILCDGILGIYLSFKRYFYKFKELFIILFMQAVLSPAIAILLISLKIDGLLSRVLGLLFASIPFALYALLIIGINKVKSEDFKINAKLGAKSLPLGISSALRCETDRLMTSGILGSVAMAKYSVAHSLGGALGFLSTSICSSLNPWILRRLAKNDIQGASFIIGEIYRIVFCAILYLVAFSPEALKILSPIEYWDILPAVAPIALSSLPSLIITTTTVALVFRGKNGTCAAVSIALVNLFISFGLIKAIGLFGASFSVLFVDLIGAVIGYSSLKKLKLENLLPIDSIFKTTIKLLPILIIMTLLKDFPQFRVLFLIPPSIMLLNTAFGVKSALIEQP